MEILNVAIASDRTDPAFHIKKIVEKLAYKEYDALIIKTKDVKAIKPLLKIIKIPIYLQVSVTGLNGNILERNSVNNSETLEFLSDLLSVPMYRKNLLPRTAISIDPIIPTITDQNILKELIDQFTEIGIRNFIVGMLDYQPRIHKKLPESVKECYNSNKSGFYSLGLEEFRIFSEFREALDVNVISNITDLIHSEFKTFDLLSYSDVCKFECGYCYAGHHRL